MLTSLCFGVRVCTHSMCPRTHAGGQRTVVRGQVSSSTLFLSMVSLVSAYDPGNSPVSISNLAIRELGLKI